MSNKAYSCGFAFDGDGTESTGRVLLIEKRRPTWQAGSLNGLGGHIEPGETPLEAMIREMQEEAGLDVLDWQPVADLSGAGFIVHFFAAFNVDIDAAIALTDEPIFIHELAALPLNLLPNLRLLIALALDGSGIAKPVLLANAA
jgi:8-oxo-dGTP pyrophosphatase MutT (NUDIX family)